MNDLRNPYIAGAPVVETSMFFGRDDVFNWIERSLAGKFTDHILVLHGQRRVGKTAVLKQIPNFLPQRYIQVFFDLQGRTNTTLARFLWWLAREIVRTLRVERDIQLARPARTAYEDDPETFINDFLPTLKSALGDHVLLLTFDEFDTLDQPESQGTLAIPLIYYLRRLMAFEGLSFIFSIGSSGNKLENMQASYTEFFKSALYRKISFLTKDDSYRLITKPVEGVLTYDSKAIDRIYEITSGHPYFTQLMCHELFSLCQKTGAHTISMGDVDSVLDDVIERGTVNLKFVWDEATDLEKWILATLAQIEAGASTHHLHGALQGQHIRFSEPDIYSAIIRLRDKEILNRDNNFVVHLLLLWLRRNRPLDRVREELVETNPVVNRYLEIADTYRDQGQFSKALENYQNVLGEDPQNLQAQVGIGKLQFEAGDFESAAAAYQAALDLDAEDIGALTGYCDTCLAWGEQMQQAQQTVEAIDQYNRVLAIASEHSDARDRLATIHRDQAECFLVEDQDQEALIAFQTARNFNPEDTELAQRVEAVLSEKKDSVLASFTSQAEAAQENGDWDVAIQAVENALLIAGEDKNLQENLEDLNRKRREHLLAILPGQAETSVKDENWTAVIRTWEEYLNLDPPDPQEAQVFLENATQMKAVQDLYTQALEKMATRDYPQAIERLRKVIQVDPGYKDTSDLLAAAVRASRKVKPNWRRIAWAASPILLAVILGLGYLGLKQTGGWETARTWVESFSFEDINPFHRNTPTPELALAASRTPTRTVAASPSATVPTHTPTPSATETITLTPTKWPTRTATPPPSWVTDFAQPILDSISGQEPTIQDDFSAPSGVWKVKPEHRLSFDNGEMTLAKGHLKGRGAIWRDIWYPHVVIELDYHFLFLPGDSGNDDWALYYRTGGGWPPLGGHTYTFHYNGDVEAGFQTADELQVSTRLPRIALAGKAVNHVLLIAKDQEFALYLNGKPVFHKVGEPIFLNGSIVFNMFEKAMAIDNFKLWDISGFSLEATPAP